MRFEAKEGDNDNGPTLLSAFIEADRGTMTNPQFAEKVGAYNLAAQQWSTREMVQEAKGEGAARPFPQVLVVTTGPTRVRNLMKTISEKAAEGVVWAVIDWAGLRGVSKVLTDPVWGKATKGRAAAERALLPGLVDRLGEAQS
jgi:UDP:flavonoid glycosyltransferase YjiC (YdhE family)